MHALKLWGLTSDLCMHGTADSAGSTHEIEYTVPLKHFKSLSASFLSISGNPVIACALTSWCQSPAPSCTTWLCPSLAHFGCVWARIACISQPRSQACQSTWVTLGLTTVLFICYCMPRLTCAWYCAVEPREHEPRVHSQQC